MGKGIALNNGQTLLDTIDSNGNVVTVDVGINKEGARITAKREGSRASKIEKRSAVPAPTKPQPTALVKAQVTWGDVQNVQDVLRHSEALGVSLMGVYRQVNAEGQRIVYFLLSKKVPKDDSQPEKMYYNKGEFKTVYMYVRMTEYGDFDVTGVNRHYTKGEIERMIAGWSLIDMSEITVVDMKNTVDRMNGKNVAATAPRVLSIAG